MTTHRASTPSISITSLTTEQREAIDAALLVLARRSHPRAERWWGIGGGGTAKYLYCYICDRRLDTYSAKYPMPRHVKQAGESHLAWHVERGDVGEAGRP